MVGRVISHYEIREKLGAGGMGVVYKAYDTRLERTIALKFLSSQSSLDAEDKTRFLHEARAASALDHPNIAVVHEIGEDSEGQMFIAMAYYDGAPLKKKIADGISTAEAVDFGIQITRALEHAHRHGIVHRDIKPGNIIITPAGTVKIIDFGLAKLRDATVTLGTTAGTLPYMSPEQTSGGDIDQRTDIWSLGTVLFEMLTGRPAFSGDSAAVTYAIAHSEPPRLRDFRPDLPAELDRVVHGCLQKQRDRRYSDAAEAARDLEKVGTAAPRGAHPRTRAIIIAAALIAAIVAGWFVRQSLRVRWAHNQALPEIEQLAAEGQNVRALEIATQVEKIIPGNPRLGALLREIASQTSFTTDPPGALIEFKEYASADDTWTAIGRTPLKAARVPVAHLRWRISKPGFALMHAAFATGWRPEFRFHLDPEGTMPPGMVSVPGGRYGLNITELGSLGPYNMTPFFIDQFEVTNRQFKEFVDAGGYERRDLWRHRFVDGSNTLSWEQGIARFRDLTGRPGPATWEGGRYPDGKDDYPVGGVSWYEAAAYAEFAGKSLPTIVHWFKAADRWSSPYILPLSNISGTDVAPVGKFKGMSLYGTYDMAGNLREWCWNEESSGQRFILGGAWNQGAHLFSNNADTRAPLDRSPGNGFRCVKYTAEVSQELLAPKPRRYVVDYNKEKPVSDEIFRSFLSLYAYDRNDVHAKTELVKETRDWREEKITIDTAYENERMAVYVFLPKNAVPPYQSVIYFTGSGASYLNTSERLMGELHYGFIVKSGRAVIYPVYWGTYERSNERALQTTPAARQERTTKWVKDLNRTLDYLETRQDLDKARIGYVGYSQGAWVAPILLGLEPRIKTGILLDGGMSMSNPPPEIHPINFASRLKVPILMLNGRYDSPTHTTGRRFRYSACLGLPRATNDTSCMRQHMMSVS